MAKREQELPKYQVRNYAEHGATTVHCQLPFSWLIKQQIDKLVHNAVSTNDEGLYVTTFGIIIIVTSQDVRSISRC